MRFQGFVLASLLLVIGCSTPEMSRPDGRPGHEASLAPGSGASSSQTARTEASPPAVTADPRPLSDAPAVPPASSSAAEVPSPLPPSPRSEVSKRMRVGVLYLGRDPREGGTTWSGSSLRALPTPDLASFLEGGEHRALISSLHRGEGIPLSLGGLRILLWAGEGGRAVEKVRQVNVGPAGEPRQAVSLSRSSFRRVGRPDHMDELRFTAEAMTRKKGPLLSVDRPLEVSIELEDRSLSLPLEVKSSLEEPVSATSEDGELVVHAQLGLDAERLRLYEVEAKPGQIEQSLRQAFGAGSRIVGGDGEVIWVIATGE